MKKLNLILLLCAVMSISYAQLKVTSNGKVGINNPIPTKQLDVVGDAKVSGILNVNIIEFGTNAKTNGFTVSNGNTNDLIFSTDYCDIDLNLGLKPSYDLTGFLGTPNNLFCELHVDHAYVGTDVYTSELYTDYLYQTSDKRKKENIKQITDALSIITQMEGKTFDYKAEMYDSVKNSETKKELIEKSKNHAGFLAQDVESILPQAVYHNKKTDAYYIDYVAVIPYLVEAIKELKGKVDVLSSNSTVKEINKSSVKSSVKSSPADVNLATTLYQNTPNPFSQSTEIKYYLPKTVNKALLCIYDLQGKQLKQITIAERGEGSQTINGAEFSAGIYLYGLIADGQQVDVKRMVLTE